MAKLTLAGVTNPTNSSFSATINTNSSAIETALENTLSRDGTSPNQMGADFDMDSNRILNLPEPVSGSEPFRLQDHTDFLTDYDFDALTAAVTAAETAANNAEASAISGAASASAAATAETNAETAETNAETAETNAEAAQTAAEAAQTAAEAAATTAESNATVIAGGRWTFDSSTSMADPGTGDWRFNNATVASVTAIAIDDQTASTGNPDVSSWLTTWDDSTNTAKGTLLIQKLGTPATFAIFTITGLTDNSGWVELAVTHVASSGVWSVADEASFQFFPTGDKGADGTMSGPVSSTDNAVARFDGTDGATVQNSGVIIDDTNNVTGIVNLTTSGNIELGHASDTTISRTGAGAIAVEGVGVALNSTSAIHTAGTIELGAASDTTLARSAAGKVTIEGNLIAAITDPNADRVLIWDDSAGDYVAATLQGPIAISDTTLRVSETFGIALSDETTAITTGTNKATMSLPFAFTVTSVYATLNTVSSSGTPTVDINENGTTILSTKLTIDANEKTSATAASSAVISDASIAANAEIGFDIDTAGTGAKGLKVFITGYRT